MVNPEEKQEDEKKNSWKDPLIIISLITALGAVFGSYVHYKNSETEKEKLNNQLFVQKQELDRLKLKDKKVSDIIVSQIEEFQKDIITLDSIINALTIEIRTAERAKYFNYINSYDTTKTEWAKRRARSDYALNEDRIVKCEMKIKEAQEKKEKLKIAKVNYIKDIASFK